MQQNGTNDAELLLQQLNIIRVRARFLPARHPSVQEVIHETAQTAQRLLKQYNNLVLVLRANEFYLNGRRLPKESLRFPALIEALGELQIHSLHFQPGVSEVELTRFADVCFVHGEKFDPAKVAEVLKSQPFEHILVNQEDLAQLGGEDALESEGATLREAREAYNEAVRAAVETQYDSLSGKSLNVQLTMNVVDMLQQGLANHADAYFAMSQLREFNEYTYYHSVNVAMICMLLAKGIGLDNERVKTIGTAAMLHDVGKVCVPEGILDKPGRLDEKERQIMETHPVDSVRILLDQDDIPAPSLAVAAQHHVRYDLTGYPDFAGFGELHLFSHIATIADVYDALRSARSYKPAMLPDKAMEIMLEGAGKTFHPVLIKAFFRMLGFYPVGSAVELDTGEIAVVTHAHPGAPLHPQVRIVGGASYTEDFAIDLNLRSASGEHPRNILRSIDPEDFGIKIAEHLN